MIAILSMLFLLQHFDLIKLILFLDSMGTKSIYLIAKQGDIAFADISLGLVTDSGIPEAFLVMRGIEYHGNSPCMPVCTEEV
jgi:hypothetical protein